MSDAGKDYKEMRDMTAHLTHVEARENQRSTSICNSTGTFHAINLEKKQNDYLCRSIWRDIERKC